MRRLKAAVRRALRSVGWDVRRYGTRRPGSDPYADMLRLLGRTPETIFDVGANVGQSVRAFRSWFPAATIHSFEPGPDTFRALTANVGGLPGVRLRECAVGSMEGEVVLREHRHSDMSSMLRPAEMAWGGVVRETPVRSVTIDGLCEAEGIEAIDVLKSDTQGYELEVFRGADRMMREGRIALIYFEVIFSRMYEGLPSVGALCDHLTARGYRLASIYETHFQVGLASWTDVLFVHGSLVRDTGPRTA